MLKFMYNGIKDSEGNLNKCFYSYGYKTKDERQLSVYAKGYKGFSKEIREAFTVKNESDYLSDYVVEDKFNVSTDHKYFKPVMQALLKFEERSLIKLQRSLLKLRVKVTEGLADSRSISYRLADIETQKIHISFIKGL